MRRRKSIIWFSIAAATVAAAYLTGRWSRPAPPHSQAHLSERNDSRARLPSADRSTWNNVFRAPTAARRTLALADRIDLCNSSNDFHKAIQTIIADSDKTEKTRHLALLFDAWLERDPLLALAGVRRVELLRHDAGRVAGTFATWATNQPLAAADLLRQALDGRQCDPSARPPFLDGVDPPEFLLSIVHGLGLADPSLAAKTLTNAAAGLVRSSAIEVLLQDWYPLDPEAVRTWAASVTDPVTRETALTTTGTKAGQTSDPAAAIEWAKQLPSAADRQTALTALAREWSQRHASDAFSWAASLPEDDLKFLLMPHVLRHLAIIDPGRAADWLNRYDAGPSMDSSVAAYAAAIQFTNPSAAIGSAASITDPERRDKLILRIANEWLARDPEAATALRNIPNLPEQVRSNLPHAPAVP